MINKHRLLNRFIKYVKIDSLSKKEKKFAEYIKKELRSLGHTVHQDNAGQKISGDTGNIFSAIQGKVKGVPRILFNAHLDTVPPGTNIKPKFRNGVIKSDGTTILGADNKAGVAVIMEVLHYIKESKLPHGDLDIIFTVAEEIGLCGAKFIDKGFLKADMGYVLDGGDTDKIINRAPSQDSIEVKITGKAAHAGVRPESGINSIKVAGIALSKMKLGRIDKETTSNIGVINGGIATNIVPEITVLKGEARSHNISKLRKQVEHMRQTFRSACRNKKAKLEFNVTPSYRAFNIKESSLALKIASKSAKASKIKAKISPTGGGSDANIFNSLGIPCLILGVGADSVHTVDENVSLDEMAKGCELVINIIKESVKCTKKR